MLKTKRPPGSSAYSQMRLTPLAATMLIFLASQLLFLPEMVAPQTAQDKKLYPVTDNGKYGFADESGNVVIRPQFEMAFEFSDGMAGIVINGKYGFVDRSGKIVVKPQYDDVSNFSDGLAVVSKDYRWGYIDISGKEVVPLQFIEARSFSEGLAAVYVDSHRANVDATWGYINKKGELVIQPRFYKAFDFHCGVAKVLTGRFGENNKQGFIDSTGNYVIKPEFELTGECSEGLIPVEFSGIDEKIGERVYSHKSGRWGYVDKTGKVTIPPQFTTADEFSGGLANVTIGEKYGYIDKTGKLVIKPQFKYSSSSYRCTNFVEGRACFERDGKIGFIDSGGNVVIEPQFEIATSFSSGIAQVDFGQLPGSENETFPITENRGLIDITGKVVYKPTNKGRTVVKQSPPVNEKEYGGWQKIEEDWFSFYAPKELKGGKGRGIDSTVYNYNGGGLNLGMDIGMYDVALPSGSNAAKLTQRESVIDGQRALIWHFEDKNGSNMKYSSGVAITFGEGYSKTHFSMFLHSKLTETEKIAEKIFASLRFKLTKDSETEN